MMVTSNMVLEKQVKEIVDAVNFILQTPLNTNSKVLTYDVSDIEYAGCFH